jgi:hypothetical protein
MLYDGPLANIKSHFSYKQSHATGVRNQTFPPFVVTIIIISLIDKMANNIMHGLKQYMIWFSIIIHDKKTAMGETTCNEGPIPFDLG